MTSPLWMLLIVLIVWFLPFIIVIKSDKTTGGEKLAWLLALFFVSWFVWIFYALLAPLKPINNNL
ncbi:hypothetical protein [Aliikangiella sp. IMCC44359]|uniref:hypothetical protein n=1 Tax=Aliikangiella sp. IMCC44359 TaxID=3459125 RepID=UPI00403B2339